MIVALIDNGSLEPAAHLNLRAVAASLSTRTGVNVRAVSWKHSDRITESALNGTPAWALEPFIRAMFALGQREFVFVPFFISPQGAIGSALRAQLEKLQRTVGEFEFQFAEGLADRGILPRIVADRIRSVIHEHRIAQPRIIVVDHGGPSALSAAVRDQLVANVRALMSKEVTTIVAASMEGAHPPLLAAVLRQPEFSSQGLIIAPLFLSPGRHAGPDGDVARITREANPRARLASLVGTHPLAIEALAESLKQILSQLPAHTFA
jgi:sirohydrochlorin ferrochelatase